MKRFTTALLGGLIMLMVSGCQSEEDLRAEEVDLYFAINDLDDYMEEVTDGIAGNLEAADYENLEVDLIEKHKKELDKGLEMLEDLKSPKDLEKETKAYKDEFKSLVSDIKLVLEDPSKVDIVDEHDEYYETKEDLFASFQYYELD